MSPDHHPYLSSRVRRCSLESVRHWLILVVAVVLVAACAKSREEALPPGSRVLALGDSITAGAGVSPEEAWPALLAGSTGWEVINGGVSGDTSGAALRRLPALLEEHHPVLVLVTLGGNDMLRRAPQEEIVANIEKTTILIKAHGARAVLLATPNPSLMGAVFQHLSAPDFYREVAERLQVPLIEDAVADVLSDPQLKGDPLHPNAAGHALLSEKVLEELEQIGYAR